MRTRAPSSAHRPIREPITLADDRLALSRYSVSNWRTYPPGRSVIFHVSDNSPSTARRWLWRAVTVAGATALCSALAGAAAPGAPQDHGNQAGFGYEWCVRVEVGLAPVTVDVTTGFALGREDGQGHGHWPWPWPPHHHPCPPKPTPTPSPKPSPSPTPKPSPTPTPPPSPTPPPPPPPPPSPKPKVTPRPTPSPTPTRAVVPPPVVTPPPSPPPPTVTPPRPAPSPAVTFRHPAPVPAAAPPKRTGMPPTRTVLLVTVPAVLAAGALRPRGRSSGGGRGRS